VQYCYDGGIFFLQYIQNFPTRLRPLPSSAARATVGAAGPKHGTSYTSDKDKQSQYVELLPLAMLRYHAKFGILCVKRRVREYTGHAKNCFTSLGPVDGYQGCQSGF